MDKDVEILLQDGPDNFATAEEYFEYYGKGRSVEVAREMFEFKDDHDNDCWCYWEES